MTFVKENVDVLKGDGFCGEGRTRVLRFKREDTQEGECWDSEG